MSKKKAVIVGAGPAGLTAAYELQRDSDTEITILEASEHIGGISKTVNYKGNRIDIGGHRFFSKSDWVMDWWQNVLPVTAPDEAAEFNITYQNQTRPVDLRGRGLQLIEGNQAMLVRNRLSRIYFQKKFFDYPIKLSARTALNLGPTRIAKTLATYGWAKAFPRKPENSLEDFMLNRFGSELYNTFFKEYTEKVWGVPCHEISADWGAQRIKSLSITRAVMHALKSMLPKTSGGDVPVSLIEKFLYPKLGPGQMWETVAGQVQKKGAQIRMHQKVVGMEKTDGAISTVVAEDSQTGERVKLDADMVFSTMPVRELVNGLAPAAPESVVNIATGLEYRDFLTVGVLIDKMKATRGAIEGHAANLVPDNWIYVQDKGVQVGRLQFFNNWSPYMVADPSKVWVGMEYFCNETDDLWSMSDSDLIALGISELAHIGLAEKDSLVDGTVVRQPKAYPGYFGTYDNFDTVRDYIDSIGNLFLIGRNGMHRYNNQDHSMLTARYAVEAALSGSRDRAQIWDVNIDDEYHEEQSVDEQVADADARKAA